MTDHSISTDGAEALRLLAVEDARQAKLHELLEIIREQIRLEVPREHRPEGLFQNIQDAVYTMRGRLPLMNDAAITSPLRALTTASDSDAPTIDDIPSCGSENDYRRAIGSDDPVAPEKGWLKPALDKAAARAAEMPDWMTRSDAVGPCSCDWATGECQGPVGCRAVERAKELATLRGEPVAWQRRSIGPDGEPWSTWYLHNAKRTQGDTDWDGVYSYEFRPLYAAPDWKQDQAETSRLAGK